ncbi:MAG: hypothetical protein HY321_22155 [Armatimonadetes bacterium]|nr:hypothetical protein [Armatimonadota bacterium]
MPTAVGTFEEDREATAAADELMRAGFADTTISLATAAAEAAPPAAVADEGGGGLVRGIAIGAVLGAAVGLIIGVTNIAVPGAGALASSSPLYLTILGTVVGAALGGLIGALADLSLPPPRAAPAPGAAGEELLVTVHAADEASARRAAEILGQHHARRLTIAPG